MLKHFQKYFRESTQGNHFEAQLFLTIIYNLRAERLHTTLLISPSSLRQDPLDLSFWSFFYFFASWYRRSREASSVKTNKKLGRKSWSMCHRSCSLALGFYTKLYTKSAVSESSITLGRWNLTFLPFGLSLWNLAHLFIMFRHGYNILPFLNFCQGTYLWSFKVEKKKRG